ncbi:hypothetical protein OA84_08585 [Kaistella solincola]|uniref:Carboxypeptidase-like regulatory domain-containing protein n=1 Tax=Kaistella solincola TaxID=510955 RepID=A0ABR4ZQC6_9FLAO|nr:DUF5686 family protein [Kaistella solincola]KIA83550.1 hypothetical protein OA84_08585 [Kaistella solincola]
MKKCLFALFFFVSLAAFGQSKITVFSTGDRVPIVNAEIFCKEKLAGKTDKNGVLSFKTKCKQVSVKAAGYYEDDVVVDKVMEIALSKTDPKTQSIQAVIIADKSDPRALAILKKVNDNYKENSPKSLDSYSYKSYEKISYDLDQDSIQQYNQSLDKMIDSLKMLPTPTQTTEQKKDSLETENVMKLLGRNKMFLWERATEFLFSKKYGEKVNILDNRISGLQEPVYELLALRSNRNQIPREIREENRALYRFFLTDSIMIDGRKNYVIRFRQADYKKPVQRRKFNGYLYIDAENYALKKIESNSKVKSNGMMTSIWIPIDNKWFLLQENLKLKMGSTNFDAEQPKDKNEKKQQKDGKKFGSYVYIRSDYFDFKINPDLEPKKFSGYSLSVKNSDGNSLDLYRTEPLTEREELTYTAIDSVGQKYKLDQKLNILSGLLDGKLRVGKVDFDALQLFKYNLYEGVRLGAGVKTNEKFNKYISPDAYFGYGFKDHKWKYGAGIDIKTTLEKTSYFRAEYYNDVEAAGRFNEDLWNFKMKVMNGGIDASNDRFYGFKGFKLSYQNDLTNTLTLKISAKKDREAAKFNYNFNNLGFEFENFATQLTLKYTPRSKSMMTPSGKVTYNQNYPEFYFNYEQALKTLGGDFNFSRFDFLAQHQFKTKAGLTGLRAYTGLTTDEAPIWHQFAMNGLGTASSSFNFNFTSYLGFATMEGGKYYNDKFIGYYFTHRLPFYFRTVGKTTSSFNLLYKGITGDMKNPEFHQFKFEKLNHLYQEIGFETNHILGTPFDLGLFYRVGHYATDSFKDNFAVQLKLSLLGF